MIKPKPLKKGDTVALISPSSPTPNKVLDKCINEIERLGLNVVVGKSCLSSHGFLSGSDEVRANDINSMFENKKINGIFTLRGGYGATRLLDLIDYDIVKNNPKVFSGYSDITALHIAFNQICNLITYHTPMISTELINGLDNYTQYYYESMIFSKNKITQINNPKGMEFETIVNGKVKGVLIGGNLSLICSSLGTQYEIDTKNKVLFIEDVDEEPYRIDRMLIQLKQSGKLKDSAGIIVGQFTNCISNQRDSLSVKELVSEILLMNNKPTIYNLACGHCLPTLSLPLGEEVLIDATLKKIILL